ncbi:MAG: ABC transporter ATP-binding protein [Anaerolineae bacterium]|nr:ABC transporter ATP-binding protein [Ardenticatenia bacterium]HQZ70234.1 ABC transporter ATP-binding protein [Anaerolineae bacterium]HRA21003.1 ABC transporter ATP-binding protein [Anaerolineae bacterium]
MPEIVAFEHVTKRFALSHERPSSFREAFVGLWRRRGAGGQAAAVVAPEAAASTVSTATADKAEDADSLLALDDVSFALERGGSLGFVGPNGTGKSTALKLMARILEPTAGQVWVGGRVAALLELGAGFHPDLTGRENILLNGSMMGYSAREMQPRLGRIIDFSELGRFVEMPVKHYSSGMYMRLGFATAVHLDAELLLIDEVLAVGDQAFQHKCLDRIAALRKAGVSIILVSHDNEAIKSLCDQALWLERGKLQAVGTTDKVIGAYYASMIAREESRLAADRAAAGESLDDVIQTQPDRWGSGEVEITAVETLGPDGRQHEILPADEPATVRIRYQARERIVGPVFGLGIHRQDGVHITGPNTRDAGLRIEAIEGRGHIDFHMPRLPLLPGHYEISASIYDSGCTHPFDYHHRRYQLRVHAGSLHEPLGLVHIDAVWELGEG